MNWTKASVTIKANGEKTITYICMDNTRLRVESRKEQMPHADGVGFWWFTSYVVILDGKSVKAKHTLKEAMAFAEALDLT